MLRLVIADDEESMLEGLSTLVDWGALGYELAAAFRDGERVIDYVNHHPVDVILTDIRMPRKSGVDVAEYVFERGLPIRVVLLSAHRDFEAARMAMRYGVHDYITKPFMLDSLREVMSAAAAHVERLKAEQSLDDQARERMEEMRAFMRENFFKEAAMGALRHPYAFDRWVQMLRVDDKCLSSRCALYALDWEKPLIELKRLVSENLPGEYGCAFRLRGGEARLLCLESSLPVDGPDYPIRLERAIGSVRARLLAAARDIRALSLMDRLESAAPDEPAQPRDNAAAEACAYIDAHYGERISLVDVANHVHLNPTYLSRMFSEQTRYSFRDYLTNTRVQAAARMLATTQSPVYAICEAVGYGDLKHFYKVFKQVMGVTPTEYRAMAGEA